MSHAMSMNEFFFGSDCSVELQQCLFFQCLLFNTQGQKLADGLVCIVDIDKSLQVSMNTLIVHSL
jgi:hypothetical protein